MPSSLPWVVEELSDATVVGGKAASLAKLHALGLRVPPAVVVTDRLLRFWQASCLDVQDKAALRAAIAHNAFPQDFELALSQALRPLGVHRHAVRSSFALEDDPQALAAGVFASCTDVPPQGLLDAIRAVVASAVSETALAYAQLRNRPSLQAPVAVLIHPFVAGQAAGHVATATGQPAQVWIRQGALSPQQTAKLQTEAKRVETQLGASELEWVHSDEGITFVQWRPYRPPQSQPWTPQPAPARDFDVPAFLHEWQWDISHNPAPLSPAHQGLIAHVQTCQLGYAQQVLGGYLFYKPTPALAPPPIPVAQAQLAFDTLQAAVETDLAAQQHAPPLHHALAVFLRHYETLLGALGQTFREGRNELRQFLSHHAPLCLPLLPDLLRGVPSRATQRQSLWNQVRHAPDEAHAAAAWAVYLEEFGDEAAAWDLAVPTVRELPLSWSAASGNPESTAAQASLAAYERARASVQKALPADAQAAFAATLERARTCMALAENDDALYAKLQAPIRRALLNLGEQLVQQKHLNAANHVFYLPLQMCLQWQSPDAAIANVDLQAEVHKAQELQQRQHRHPPPLGTSAHTALGVLRGHGTAGTATGRVFIFDGHGHAPPPDAIVVARTLLPTQLPLITAAALVVQSGGPLDHVAAQARERNLPAIVGVAQALDELRANDLVFVDADRGVVHLLGRSDGLSDSESLAYDWKDR